MAIDQQALHDHIKKDVRNRYRTKRFVANQPLSNNIQIDFAVELEDDVLLIIEVKMRRATTNDVMRLYFIKEKFNEITGENTKWKEVKAILYASVVPKAVRSLAATAGIEWGTLPTEFGESSDAEARSIKVTTPNAWRVVMDIVWNKRTNIRQTSLRTGVSYGWTHSVFKHLQKTGVVAKDRGGYSVVDLDRLFNGVAWERPLDGLVLKEWRVSESSVQAVFDDILDADKDAVLTGYLATSEFVDVTRRYDLVQIYSTRLRELEHHLGSSKDGIRVSVLRTDRDMEPFRSRRLSQGAINIVPPEQLILDLAGLGFAALDLVKSLVDEGPFHG